MMHIGNLGFVEGKMWKCDIPNRIRGRIKYLASGLKAGGGLRYEESIGSQHRSETGVGATYLAKTASSIPVPSY